MDFLLHETSGAGPTNNEKIYSFSRTAVLFFSRPTAVRGLLIEHKIPVSMRIQLAKTLYGSARAD